MQTNRCLWPCLLALALSVAATAWWLRQPPGTQPQTEARSDIAPQPDVPVRHATKPPRREVAAAPSEPASLSLAADPARSRLKRWLEASSEMSEETRAQIAPWLAANRTNAGSLLAVRQAGGGREYLAMALTNFPNDPHVLFAALELDDSPEVRRARLDRFKAVAPDNALPDYLSAREHLKNGQREAAFNDLISASQKTGFQDYMLDAVQNCEEFYLAAGRPPLEAKALACSRALLPHLAPLKGLAVELSGLQRQYLAAGDTTSAENLALHAIQLSQHLSTGEGSRTMIAQLVGTAIAQIALNPLADNTTSAVFGSSVQERLAALAARKAAARADAGLLEQWLNNASELELGNYFERLKLYGETAAIEWVKQRQPGS